MRAYPIPGILSGGDSIPLPPLVNLVTWHRPEGLDIGGLAWADEGSFGNDLVDVVNNNPVEGIPVDGLATLDASSQGALQQSVSLIAQPFTVYFVTRLRTVPTTSIICDGPAAGTNRVTVFNTGTLDPATLIGNAGASLTIAGQLRRNSTQALRFTANGASSALYLTDLTTTPVATGNAGAGSWGGLTVGGRYTASNPWPGDIAEVLRYEGAHDAAGVEAYLLAKYPSIAKRDWTPFDVLCAGDSITVGVGSTDARV